MAQDEDKDVWDCDAATALTRWSIVNDMVLSAQGAKIMILCLLTGVNPPWAEKLGLEVDVLCGDMVAYLVYSHTISLRKPLDVGKSGQQIMPETNRRRRALIGMGFSIANAAIFIASNIWRILRIEHGGNSWIYFFFCIVNVLCWMIASVQVSGEMRMLCCVFFGRFWTNTGKADDGTCDRLQVTIKQGSYFVV